MPHSLEQSIFWDVRLARRRESLTRKDAASQIQNPGTYPYGIFQHVKHQIPDPHASLLLHVATGLLPVD